MTSFEIRSSFLKFFQERGHVIVPSSPVVPFDDPTLLFANAGMNQFKDVFLGNGKRPYSRAVDTQKCIRVSGKHNDLEEVGRDTYHHTFFEMLGNWSFGDYYKREAIQWAWELLTEVWGLSKDRLWATVFNDDGEAEQLWKSVTDINHSHVLRFGEKDNFWEMGETGPCGPCSEIHIDRTPLGNATAEMVNAGTPDVMEIWNLVFIQYDRDAEGKLHPLPAKHVDTGMGFERVCAVLQNKESNYDTDVFSHLIKEIAVKTGSSYDGRMDGSLRSQQAECDTAMRVIADHLRALTFAVADGAVPSNEGRGYVLRRILRRAARFGRNLGMHEPFIYTLVPSLVKSMGEVFPEIVEKQDHVEKVIKAEEEGFNATLDRGLEVFEEVVKKVESSKSKEISGDDVFKLYDTFGFPVDLTALLARERGFDIDEKGFEELMGKQRERSRGERLSQPDELAPGEPGFPFVSSKEELERFISSLQEKQFKFIGYDQLESSAKVLKASRHLVVLDRSPFYGEAGGQVGDKGIIAFEESLFNVYDTQRIGALSIHILDSAAPFVSGDTVTAKVDAERRLAIMRNHTATHLVHAALRSILGTHVHQAGSLVAPNHLRFDFAHLSKLSPEELEEIESLVNEKIREGIILTHHRNIPFEEARKMGALMFFGDKYGDRVNVVEFGEFSKEFCGGTHVPSTAEIGYFKFRSEGSVASGVRRIEAVSGDAALELLQLQDKSVIDLIDRAYRELDALSSLREEIRSVSDGSSPLVNDSFDDLLPRLDHLKQGKDFPHRVTLELKGYFDLQSQRLREGENINLLIAEKMKTFEKELAKFRLKSLIGNIDELLKSAITWNGLKLVSAQVPASSMDELKALGDTLRAKLGSGVGLLASIVGEKVALVCVVTDDLVSSNRLDAGKLVGAVAKIMGGSGGGRAHLATAGGKDIAKLPEALQSTVSVVQSFLT